MESRRAPYLTLSGKLEDGPLFLAKAKVELQILGVWTAIQTPLARAHMAGSVAAKADEPIIGIEDVAKSVAATTKFNSLAFWNFIKVVLFSHKVTTFMPFENVSTFVTYAIELSNMRSCFLHRVS
jgi:hypothetical protein